MKKSFKLLLLLLTATCTLYAQEPDWTHADGTLEGFTPGSQYFTLVSDANLRDNPGTQSKVLGKLPIGTPLTVEMVSTDSFAQRGVKLPWVKVKAQLTGKAPLIGYIWGGFLALAAIQTPDDEYTPNAGVLYLTGVAAYDEANHQLTVQVRAAKNGTELSKTEFKTQGDLSYYPSFDVKFSNLKNVKAILSVNYYYPACGYPSGDNLLFWLENNQLNRVLETTSVSDGGVFYDSQDYLLPYDKGGIYGHVLVVNDSAEMEERGEELVVTKHSYKLTLYKWDGAKLLKSKELK
ncbi:MAG: SH3 domain-containing protein [Chitinophagales bacterium]|nr:SH3 domain-containing protein [Chitinophagales bacterium]